MKTSLLLTLILVGGFSLNQLSAQMSISCNYREVCQYNSFTESFSDCYKYEENSLFKLNESETMFTHITEDIKSAYYIGSKMRDEDTGVWMLTVESDVGNDYIYFIDFEHDEIRVAVESDEELILVRFYIKRVWMD